MTDAMTSTAHCVLALSMGACIGACSAASRPTASDELGPTLKLVDSGAPGATGPGDTGSIDQGDASGDAMSDAPTDAAAADSPSEGPSSSTPMNPRCDPTHAWQGAGVVLSLPGESFARFGGVSRDELTVEWTTTSGAIYVADRAHLTDAFGAGVPVSTGSIALAADRVALGPGGTTLVAVTQDRHSLVAFERADAGAAWAASLPYALANVNAMGKDPGIGTFSEPVLGLDGTSLFFVLLPSSGPPGLVESRWDPELNEWQSGVVLGHPELAITDSAHLRRATGTSADGLTLFLFDATTQTERAAWRPAVGSDFTMFVDLPGLFEAAPNVGCDRVYYQDSESAPAAIESAQ